MWTTGHLVGSQTHTVTQWQSEVPVSCSGFHGHENFRTSNEDQDFSVTLRTLRVFLVWPEAESCCCGVVW